MSELSPEIIRILLYGTGDEILTIHRKSVYGSGSYEQKFEGIINNLERRYKDTSSNWIKEEIQTYMSEIHCDECHGDRLSKESLAVTVGGINIADFCKNPLYLRLNFLIQLSLPKKKRLFLPRL